MSLQEEIARTELKTVRKIQACGNDAAGMAVLKHRDSQIISKVLDAAIEAAETERLSDDTGDPSDIAYEAAINDVVHVIGNLKGGN